MVFDVDGVLADTEALNAAASVAMFRQLYGVEVEAEDFRPFIGTGDERYVEGVAEKYGLNIDTTAAVSRREEFFFELVRTAPVPAFPGVVDLIAQARSRGDVELAIATSGNRSKQIPVIEGAGLRLDWFAVVVTGDLVERKKPDPQIYLLAAEMLRVEPNRCVVLEDAPAGVEAAKRAGAKCVAITNSVAAKHLRGADLVVESLAAVSVDSLRPLASE